jgi:hypothetical protein
MPHLLESTYRARNAVRFRAERANKPRSHRIRCAVHNHRPSRLAKLVQRRLQRNRRLLLDQHRGLCNRLCLFRRRPFCYTLARPLRAAAYRCSASCCTACSCRSHRFRSSFAVCLSRECSPSRALKHFYRSGFVSTNPETRYFRRSTMCLSVRLLCRVFLPKVGNAHGVCG